MIEIICLWTALVAIGFTLGFIAGHSRCDKKWRDFLGFDE